MTTRVLTFPAPLAPPRKGAAPVAQRPPAQPQAPAQDSVREFVGRGVWRLPLVSAGRDVVAAVTAAGSASPRSSSRAAAAPRRRWRRSAVCSTSSTRSSHCRCSSCARRRSRDDSRSARSAAHAVATRRGPLRDAGPNPKLRRSTRRGLRASPTTISDGLWWTWNGSAAFRLDRPGGRLRCSSIRLLLPRSKRRCAPSSNS